MLIRNLKYLLILICANKVREKNKTKTSFNLQLIDLFFANFRCVLVCSFVLCFFVLFVYVKSCYSYKLFKINSQYVVSNLYARIRYVFSIKVFLEQLILIIQMLMMMQHRLQFMYCLPVTLHNTRKFECLSSIYFLSRTKQHKRLEGITK